MNRYNMKTIIILLLLIKVSLGFSQENKTVASRIKSLYEQKDCQALITECSFELNKEGLNVNDRIDFLYYRVDCYMSLNNFSEAISDWSELIKLNPNQVNYYNSFAYCYWS